MTIRLQIWLPPPSIEIVICSKKNCNQLKNNYHDIVNLKACKMDLLYKNNFLYSRVYVSSDIVSKLLDGYHNSPVIKSWRSTPEIKRLERSCLRRNMFLESEVLNEV